MLDDLSQWLLIAVKGRNAEFAKQAMKRGVNANFHDPETGRTILEMAAAEAGNNEALVRLLLKGDENHPACKADVNWPNRQFQTGLASLVKTEGVGNKALIMQLLIEARELVSEECLDHHVELCANKLSKQVNLAEDFAVLAHYMSRLCGIDVGKILNRNKNADRYFAHLSQYSASVEEQSLEGMNSLHFLSLRVFSLFEVLVKLHLSVGQSKFENERLKDCYEKKLKKEILVELGTIKLLLERNAIMMATGLTEAEKDHLYQCMAEKILARIDDRHPIESCIATGYRTHAIYCTIWCSEASDYRMRFENCGVGVHHSNGRIRHPVKGALVFPLTKVIQPAQRAALLQHIQFLLKVTVQPMLGEDYMQCTGAEAQEKRRQFQSAREEILTQLYDDAHYFSQVVEDVNALGSVRQTARTCAATSHQMSLLERQGEAFFAWAVQQEKQCIVSTHRNEGAARANELSLWLNDAYTLKHVPDAECCPMPVDLLMRWLLPRETEVDALRTELGFSDRFMLEIKQCIGTDINDLLCRSIEKRLAAFNWDEKWQQAGPRMKLFLQSIRYLYGAICMKMAINTGAMLLYEKAYQSFSWNLEFLSQCYVRDVQFFVHYFLSLLQFSLGQLSESEAGLKKCIELTQRVDNFSVGVFPRGGNGLEGYYAKVALGFVYYAKEEYQFAAAYFKEAIAEGEFFAGEEGELIEPTFGIALVTYQTRILRKRRLSDTDFSANKEVMETCQSCTHSTNSVISKRARDLLEKLRRMQRERIESLQVNMADQGAGRHQAEYFTSQGRFAWTNDAFEVGDHSASVAEHGKHQL